MKASTDPAAEPSVNTTRLLKGAAVLGPLGVASSLLGPEWVGGPLTLAGLCLGLWALHRFGRSGPDRPGARSEQTDS
jgi:hypothetical protein